MATWHKEPTWYQFIQLVENLSRRFLWFNFAPKDCIWYQIPSVLYYVSLSQCKKNLEATLDSIASALANSTGRYFFCLQLMRIKMQQGMWPQSWEMLFSSQLTLSACQCKIMCCCCVGTGILASLFHAVVFDAALVLQTSREDLSQKRACVPQRQALITGAKRTAKTQVNHF